jgi:hypothetical protein
MRKEINKIRELAIKRKAKKEKRGAAKKSQGGKKYG